jgi:iron(III) transport system ATP-binding protein
MTAVDTSVSVEIAGLRKSFGDRVVLDGVSLEIEAGSLTAILGASGSGKTTLMRLIAGFERADTGTISLGGRTVDDGGRTFQQPEKRRIGYVPQEGALFPHLSVGRNVAFGLPREERRRGRVMELLEMVGLSEQARRYPHQLSGGQQQRVALARALASDPYIVLLDEPFSSLDASLRSSVRKEVHDVLCQSGTTSILVTHDQDEALSMADRVAVLRGGVIAQINTPSRIYGLPSDPELAQFFGEANLLDGMARGRSVTTALGVLEIAFPVDGEPAGPDGPAGRRGRVSAMVRPEQLLLGEVDCSSIACVVRSYEYFGHDAVVRVQPENGRLPDLVVRVTGGTPLTPGTRVGVSASGPVMVWPQADKGAKAPE